MAREDDFFEEWLQANFGENESEEADKKKEQHFLLTEQKRNSFPARLFTTPETVFIVVHTHGSILLDDDKKKRQFHLKPFHLPKDVTVYQLNAQAPGINQIGNLNPQQELDLANLTIAESLGLPKDPLEWYDGLKALPDAEIERVLLTLQAKFKAYHHDYLVKEAPHVLRLKPKLKEDLQPPIVDPQVYADMFLHFNKIFQLHKFDASSELYEKVYTKELRHSKINTITILNKFRRTNDTDEKGEHLFLEPFEYFHNDYAKPIFLSKMIQDLADDGAKRIIIIDLSCGSFNVLPGVLTSREIRALRQNILASANKLQIEPPITGKRKGGKRSRGKRSRGQRSRGQRSRGKSKHNYTRKHKRT
jgi:hypothetical protein